MTSGYAILNGDALDLLKKLPAASFDAAFCDPPYGISFMGKQWDHGVPRADVWAEVLRVLKPGAPLLAFGGTRTHHRLMCALEDAGFEIRDCLMWIYGQGFPKSLDISKAIDRQAGAKREVIERRRMRSGGTEHINRANVVQDFRPHAYQKGENILDITAPATDAAKQFDGYGTALKPAWEPIILAMKPCDGTFAANASKHSVAGLNIDAGRIALNGERPSAGSGNRRNSAVYAQDTWTKTHLHPGNETPESGRWPANVILDPDTAAQLDAQSGHLVSGNNPSRRSADKHRGVYAGWKGEQCLVHRGTDAGGASRFFYCAKASKKERGEGNTHPTVKPLKLCEYLARLILPPHKNARLLVPFSGSGSEIIGAKRAGWKRITAIERERQYVAIAKRRLTAAA